MSPVCLLLILGMLEPASVAQGHGASACDSQNAPSCDEVEFLQSRHERKRKLQVTACSDVNQDCRATGCCANESFTCYEKDEYWASCRESCSPGINPADPPEHQTPWSCNVLSRASSATRRTSIGLPAGRAVSLVSTPTTRPSIRRPGPAMSSVMARALCHLPKRGPLVPERWAPA